MASPTFDVPVFRQFPAAIKTMIYFAHASAVLFQLLIIPSVFHFRLVLFERKNAPNSYTSF